MKLYIGMLAIILSSSAFAGEKDFPHRHGDHKHDHMVHANEHLYSDIGHNHNRNDYLFAKKRKNRQIRKFIDGRIMITGSDKKSNHYAEEIADSGK